MMKRYALFTLFVFAIPASAAQQPSGDPGTETISAAPSFEPVTHERLLNSSAEPENWLMYSGDYFSQRYSRLSQINKENVGQLQMQWAFQLRALDRAETTPLVVDGVMYVTEAPSNVIALDARTGSQYWRYNHDLPDDLNYCCGRNNRGGAVLGGEAGLENLLGDRDDVSAHRQEGVHRRRGVHLRGRAVQGRVGLAVGKQQHRLLVGAERNLPRPQLRAEH